MELIRILGVDPSLRFTGLAVVTYNTETKEKKVENCQVLINPPVYKGTEAILHMLDMIKDESSDENYSNVDAVIVESPPIMFNKTWAAGTISSLSHVAGGAIALLGLHKGYLFKPTEWNGSRKKEVTHNNTIIELGSSEDWGYKKRVKNEKHIEHILDAASIALWWINRNFDMEDEE